ncbi:efflux RND transporter permease subunit [Dyella sp. A6]|uniref:efflux RND transporter permease subunit n=1 Tax=Dyella aluminiiresistens TaxID=3069105 RepID=UPI002E7A802B|nr:efflux RND transporter permease subunit [Dyella sp. A6]
MNISGPFIRRPIGTSLLAIGIFVAGLICYVGLGVAALPDMSFPVIFVQASEAGASATTMATTVAAPLERHLGQVPGIDMMHSSSSQGSTFVFLMFNAGVDINAAAQDVQAQINAAQADLPSGLTSQPSYRKANPNDDPVIELALTSKTQSVRSLYDVADSLLAQRVRQIDGVSEVDIAGASTPAIRVDVDMRKLNSMGLTMDSVRNAISAANNTSPLGTLDNGITSMTVTANDSMHSVDQFANLIVSTQNGTPVRLSDIAHVYQGTQDRYQAGWFQGKPAILLYVYKQSDANVIATVDRVKAALPELRAYLQPGTKLTPFFDGTPTIRNSLREVQLTLLISLGMVVLVMALFLRRIAPTMIAAGAVPLSLAGAAVVMYAFGYTLNNLTLLALVVAIGFVVDDAIVMIENVIRHMDAGMTRREAALKGAKEIGFTIVSITASLVAVFAPLIFMGGITGMFFKQFTVTLVAAIVLSATVSLTFTPAMCACFLKSFDTVAPRPPSRLGRALDRMLEGMHRVYERALDFALRHAVVLALTPLVLIFVTIFLFGQLQFTMFPAQDTGLIRGISMSGATASFQESVHRQQRFNDMLLADKDVAMVSSHLGTSRQGASAFFDVELKTHAQGRTDSTMQALQRLSTMASHYPDLDVRMRAVQDLPSFGGRGSNQGAQYQIGIKGDSLTELEAWLPKLVDQLKKNPKLLDVGSDMGKSGLEQDLVVNRDKAAALGLGMGSVDTVLYDALGQRSVSKIYSNLNQYSVVLGVAPDQMQTPADLDTIYFKGKSSSVAGTPQMIPLAALAHQVPSLTPTHINHHDQSTVENLSFNLAPGVTMGQAMQIIEKTVQNMRMPGDIKLELGGDFRRLRQSQNGGILLLLAAILAVYIVLGILYESLIHPITILSTLPAAGVGALLALYITHTPLSVIAQIALVLLIGIVKKNAIMMIDFALVAEREHGVSAREAAREACMVRFRPIMMTTMVAILAALPIAIGLGQGSDLRRPLGIAMIGGLLFSQSLTLLSTPALYVVFSGLSERWHAWRNRRRLRLLEQAG